MQLRTRRFRTSKLTALMAASALAFSAAPALAQHSHNHRYAGGFRCVDLHGGKFHAGVLIINGWAYDIDTRNVKRDIVKAFRHAGYDARIIGYRVDVCFGYRRAPRVDFITGEMIAPITCAGDTLTIKPQWADPCRRAANRTAHSRGSRANYGAPISRPISRPVSRPVSHTVRSAPVACPPPPSACEPDRRGRWSDRRGRWGRHFDRGFHISIGSGRTSSRR